MGKEVNVKLNAVRVTTNEKGKPSLDGELSKGTLKVGKTSISKKREYKTR